MTSSASQTTLTTDSTMTSSVRRDGYDLELYGLDNGSFYTLHIMAIICILCSLVSAIAVLYFSFRTRPCRTFYSWTRSERFVVYLAICDGAFNVFHLIDHSHIAIAKEQVRPKELCEFYGFTLAVFITAQNLMVNIIAINAFVLMYFRRQLQYGFKDWRLVTWTFGAPFLGAAVCGISGQLGPNNVFCFFDGVNGVIAQICFTTVPLIIITVMNSVLYALTWQRIRQETKRLSTLTSLRKASHSVARTMSLFVVAFIVQWWAMFIFGIWSLFEEAPQILYHFVTTFSNIGGVLNLAVYLIIRRRALIQRVIQTDTTKT